MNRSLSPDSGFLFAPRTRAEYDRDYSPSLFVSSLDDVVADWCSRTTAERRAHGLRFERLAFGPDPHQVIDLYRSVRGGGPLLVFIHGGFWQALSADESGFMAGTWTAAGFDVAIMDYRLAPAVTLPIIVADVEAGLTMLTGRFGFPTRDMIVAGHSAGAHLAAMVACKCDFAGVVLVSGVFELEPVRRSYVNDAMGLTEADVAQLSPARLTPRRGTAACLIVGENEPVAFHEQSRVLASAWRERGAAVHFELGSRRTHFDILDDLCTPHSAVSAWIASQAGARQGKA